MADTSSRQSKQNRTVKRTDSSEVEKHDAKGADGSFASDTLKKTGESFAELGKGIFEQLMNLSEQAEKEQRNAKEEVKQEPKKIERRSLFNYTEMQERRQINEIQMLLRQVKAEVDAIKNADSRMMSEINDIDNMTLMSIPERPGIYHVRLLEVFLKLLRSVRMKISESSKWLAVARGKRSGGNLFNARSKKMGGNYANSAEHSLARNTG